MSETTVVARALHALSHPIRLSVLLRLDEPASPSKLARVLGEPLGVVSYHVRVLHSRGLLKVAKKGRSRTGEHVYELSELGWLLRAIAREAMLRLGAPPDLADDVVTAC